MNAENSLKSPAHRRYSSRPAGGRTENLSALGRWRIANKKKLSDLSELTGYPVPTIAKHCTGQRTPTDPRVIRTYAEITDGAVTAEHWYGNAAHGSEDHS